jgi:hypothetical protein
MWVGILNAIECAKWHIVYAPFLASHEIAWNPTFVCQLLKFDRRHLCLFSTLAQLPDTEQPSTPGQSFTC